MAKMTTWSGGVRRFGRLCVPSTESSETSAVADNPRRKRPAVPSGPPVKSMCVVPAAPVSQPRTARIVARLVDR